MTTTDITDLPAAYLGSHTLMLTVSVEPGSPKINKCICYFILELERNPTKYLHGKSL